MSTTYLWDASNYDDPITVRDGIDGYTHKIAEGHHFYRDVEYRQSLENARALGIPILGAYFVNHPGSVADQVDWFVQLLDQDTPWWRTWPGFILQIDAEKFSYMPSAPTPAEIQAFGDRLVSVHGVKPSQILAYAPQWLYGNSMAGIVTYPLWASAYGANPYVHYPEAYPGNDSPRWQSYSGQSPLLLQYGSNTTIGNQTTCDANGYRGTADELLLALGGDDDMTPVQENILIAIDNRLRQSVILGHSPFDDTPGSGPGQDAWIVDKVNALEAKLDRLLALLAAGVPVDLTGVTQAAHDGAKAGAGEAIDGATTTGTVHKAI